MALDLGTLVGKLELDGSKFDSALDALPGKLSSKSTLLAGAAGIAAGGITAALVKGIDTGLDLQDAGNKAMAQLGLTKAESKSIGDIAGRLYADAYGDSIDGVSDAVTDVVSSIQGMRGASDSAVEAMTAKVLNFNSTFGVETSRTTQLVGQMLKTGLANDADQAMDLLTASLQRVPKSVREDVLDAVDEYGPFFQQLGLAGDEAMQALVKGSEQGMYGIDKTGDALKELTIRATDMSTSSVQAYQQAGLNAQDMAAKFLAGGDTARGALSELVAGLQGIDDPATRANAAIALFGTPLEDLGTSKIPAFLDSISGASGGMQDFAGAADKMGDAVNGGARTGWTELTRQFEMTVGIIGQQLVPVLSDLIGFLNDNPAILNAVVIAVLALAAAFVVFTAATWAQNAALYASPLTWIILAIVAAIAILVVGITLLVQHWSEITAWLGDVGGAIWGWLQGVIQGFVDWWNGVWSGFGDGVAAAWGAIVSFFDGIGAWWSGLWAGFGGMLADGWNAALAFLAALPGQFVSWLASLGSSILAGLAALPGLLYDGMVNGIAYGLAALYTLFVTLPQQILGWLAGAAQWLWDTGSQIIQGMLSGLIAAHMAVSAWFAALPSRILAFLVSAATWLLTTGQNLIAGLQNGIQAAWAAAAAWFAALPSRILGFLVSFGTLLISIGSNLINGLRSGVTNAWTATAAWFAALPSRILGFLVGFASLLISQGTALLNGLRLGIENGWSAVTGFLSGLPGRIVSALGSFGSTLLGAGRSLMDGLLQGIRNGLGSILGAISGMAGDIMNKFKSILGIHSPSTVFRGYGMNIGEGLIQGLVGMSSKVDAAVSDLVTIPTARMAVEGVVGDMTLGEIAGAAGSSRGGVDVSLEVHGNVGWDADEVANRMGDMTSRAMILEGIDDMVGVK